MTARAKKGNAKRKPSGATGSLDWLTPSATPPGQDPMLAWMKQEGIPLTRAEYLKAADLKEPLSGEEEMELPEQFRLDLSD